MSDEIDEEALERYVGWVEEGRAQPKVYETPLGVKLAADRGPGDLAPEYGRPEVMSFREAIGVWEDEIVSIYEGELDAVNEVEEEWWEEFVTVADAALDDVGEEELRAARDE
ncbi:hypothetical protein GRS48_12710 [Halorubrum sp. JWXQ-INN 858]|uniref:hypothetical protein n=1 Tax=Halorubrum sp. JWXQ-INN 858 TaxID=2690782 RepID=UPI00135A5FC9|nr:hypothetical protein [Halorubrum sp. JWXQ-INN 858]MWV65674.1 hypothetical protein [Halorubrum sp. JWXQ-INN 858]